MCIRDRLTAWRWQIHLLQSTVPYCAVLRILSCSAVSKGCLLYTSSGKFTYFTCRCCKSFIWIKHIKNIWGRSWEQSLLFESVCWSWSHEPVSYTHLIKAKYIIWKTHTPAKIILPTGTLCIRINPMLISKVTVAMTRIFVFHVMPLPFM